MIPETPVSRRIKILAIKAGFKESQLYVCPKQKM